MPQNPGAVASCMLLVGSDEATTTRLRAALPADLDSALHALDAQAPDTVLAELRARGAELVLLGPSLSASERARLLMGLRAGDDAVVVTLGGEVDVGAGIADDHLGPDEDATRFLTRCLREASLRRVAREAARRAERMGTVAQVAGGVAHDFGNFLQVIQGQTELLRTGLGDAGEGSEPLAAIEEATEHAVALVRRLLALGVEPSARQESIAVDEILAGMEPILAGLLGPEQRVDLDLGCGDARLLVDPASFEQALLNLVINASHAMSRRGCLRVRSRRQTFTPPSGSASIPALIVEVEDDGCGMPRGVAERAFEPFFSTRSASEGSGLGLSSVMDVVRRCGGTAAIESEPGQGTTVRLILPELRAAQARAPEAVRPPAQPARGREPKVVLFVDDEPLVVNVVRNILERAGYAHLTVADADEAEAVFHEQGGRIDLLVTDVKMPGRNGCELYEALRARQPDLPVVFVSGYVDDPLFADAMEDADLQRLVPKPFRPAQLLEVIEDVLETACAKTQS